MNGPMFFVYVKQCLVPTLKRGETVLMVNLPVHKVGGVAEAIKAAGATLIYLPSIRPTSTRSNRTSANSRPICAKAAEHTIVVSGARCYRLQRAEMRSAMQATFEPDRNPL
jgi:hypothetical protein